MIDDVLGVRGVYGTVMLLWVDPRVSADHQSSAVAACPYGKRGVAHDVSWP